MRYPSIILGGVSFFLPQYVGNYNFLIFQLVAQLAIFPVGRVWARVVPSIKIFGHSLNNGPFTIKEHVRSVFLVTILELNLSRSWLR
jgi:hypothetical protein